MFTNVVVRWPGSTHDSHIFRTSAIGGNLEGTGLAGGVLLGDSGHAALHSSWLHTSTPNTLRGAFQKSTRDLRCTIRQTFWLLKRRFYELHSEVRMAPHRVCTMIVACCILHNLTVNQGNQSQRTVHGWWRCCWPSHPVPWLWNW